MATMPGMIVCLQQYNMFSNKLLAVTKHVSINSVDNKVHIVNGKTKFDY